MGEVTAVVVRRCDRGEKKQTQPSPAEMDLGTAKTRDKTKGVNGLLRPIRRTNRKKTTTT